MLRRSSRCPAALVDKFNRAHSYLRVAVTERCNLRCKYCMPEEGVELTPSQRLATADEIIRIVDICAGLGIVKVRLTGGEPLVRHDIEDICTRIRSIPGISTLAMTTNGILLPRKIAKLHAAGVTGLNISLDSLDEAKYSFITRRNGLSKVLKSLDMAEALAFDPIKINCVVIRGLNSDELYHVASLARSRPFEVRFIEYMPFDGNKWSQEKMMNFMEMMDVIEGKSGQRLVHIRNGEVAKVFHVPGWKGTIGFITPMSNNFCGTCNRIRLTADGMLKVCLFGEETPLLEKLRGGATNEEMGEVIRQAVLGKHASYGGKENAEHIASCANRPMIKIGG